MKDRIYLVCDEYSVRRMTKREPRLTHGETAVMVDVEADPGALQAPTVAQRMHVTDWRNGLDLGGVTIRQSFITIGAAAAVRDEILTRMAAALEAAGFEVIPPAELVPALTAGDGETG